MALDLEAVHRAAADIIRAGLGAWFTVAPFPSNSQQPMIEVWPGSDRWVAYHPTQNGVSDLSLVIRVEAMLGNAETGFLVMTRACSPSSPICVAALLEAEPTLRGTVAAFEIADARWEADPATGSQIAWIPLEAYE